MCNKVVVVVWNWLKTPFADYGQRLTVSYSEKWFTQIYRAPCGNHIGADRDWNQQGGENQHKQSEF